MEYQSWYVSINAIDIFLILNLVGSLAIKTFVVPKDTFDRSWRVGIIILLTFISVNTIILFLLRSLMICECGLAELPIYNFLSTTHFGQMLSLRALMVCGLWLWFLLFKSIRLAGWLQLIILLYAQSSLTHAGDEGNFTSRLLIDVIHYLFAGLWVGSVFFITFTTFAFIRYYPITFTRKMVRRLSSLATVAVTGAFITGFYKVYPLIFEWRRVLDSDYGIFLAIKLGLILVMILIAAVNRFVYIPQFDGAPQSTTLKKILALITLEAIVIPFMVVFIALLINSMPPQLS